MKVSGKHLKTGLYKSHNFNDFCRRFVPGLKRNFKMLIEQAGFVTKNI